MTEPTEQDEEELEVELGAESGELWLSEGDAYFPDSVGFFESHPEIIFADRDLEGGVLFGVVGKGVISASEYLKGLKREDAPALNGNVLPMGRKGK